MKKKINYCQIAYSSFWGLEFYCTLPSKLLGEPDCCFEKIGCRDEDICLCHTARKNIKEVIIKKILEKT